MEIKKGPRVSGGIASLVAIFSVLCLTVFSVLSLSTALAEKNLAQKSSQAVRDYYAADLICADKAEKIGALAKQNLSVEDFFRQAESLGAQITQTGNGWLVSYSQAIDENQDLFVRLSVSGRLVIIQSWQVRRTGAWAPDDSIRVWSGE